MSGADDEPIRSRVGPPLSIDAIPDLAPATIDAAGVSRLAGCLWLVFAGLGLVVLAGLAGVGIDAAGLPMVVVGIPFALAVIVSLAGDRVPAAALSLGAGLAYAALGVWNSVRAADLERANPGVADASGGPISVIVVLFGVAIAAWSLGAMALLRRSARDDAS